MSSIKCSEEIFRGDVARHEFGVIHDVGSHRHIRFMAPGDCAYQFDLITWPYHLCVSGDMGTYVFSRNCEMFGFFNDGNGPDAPLRINPDYWGEKLVSICRYGGHKEFSEDLFTEAPKYEAGDENLFGLLDEEAPDKNCDFTFHFIWNCYAILWGVRRFFA